MTFSDPAFAALTWDKAHRGAKLDLAGYKQVWRDDFNSLSVSGSDGVGTKWFSPARTGFGGAVFREYVPPPVLQPQPAQPVRLQLATSGQLVIRMEKVGDVYQTAHLQTVNRTLSDGWAQTMGYFEASMRFPKGFATWPSFWLISRDPAVPRVEIDVVEAYGGNDYDGHHATIHLARTYHKPQYTALGTANDAVSDLLLFNSTNNNMFDGRYHRYGALLDDEAVKIFYDGVELARFPMTAYFRTPLYMLMTLAMFEPEKAQFVSPKDMYVDYVRAFAK